MWACEAACARLLCGLLVRFLILFFALELRPLRPLYAPANSAYRQWFGSFFQICSPPSQNEHLCPKSASLANRPRLRGLLSSCWAGSGEALENNDLQGMRSRDIARDIRMILTKNIATERSRHNFQAHWHELCTGQCGNIARKNGGTAPRQADPPKKSKVLVNLTANGDVRKKFGDTFQRMSCL